MKMRYVLIGMKNHNTSTDMCKMIMFVIKQTGAIVQQEQSLLVLTGQVT